MATAAQPSPKSKNPQKHLPGNGVDASVPDYLPVILMGLQSMRDGDFSVRLPGSWTGLAGKIADHFNEIVSANEQMARELKRVGQVVGKEGKTRERIRVPRHRGAWGEMEVSVNTLVEDLLRPTTEVTRAIAAVAQGNLTQTVRLDVDGRPLEGEFLRSANIVNTMIQQLGVFTAEVTRVAREVGTDGKLGGQAVRSPASPAPGRTSPTRSTPWPATSPARCATSPKSPPPLPAATFPARLPSTSAAKFSSSKKPSIRWSTSCARSPPK